MSTTLNESIVEHIQLAAHTAKQAAVEIDRHEKRSAACREMIPATVEALVKHARILPEQREKVAKLLEDPREAYHLLIKLAGHRNPEEASALGTPSRTKTAGVNASASKHVPEWRQAADNQLAAAVGVSS